MADGVHTRREIAELSPVGASAPSSPWVPEALTDRLLEPSELSAAVWWVGVHGGAGESTLEQLFAGSRAAGHRWPLAAEDVRPVVALVARTSARGLVAAQHAAHDCWTRELALELRGLVLIADAPGRLPRPLRELMAIAAGAVPRVWLLPWVDAWRTGELPAPANSPREAEGLLADLRSASRSAGKDG